MSFFSRETRRLGRPHLWLIRFIGLIVPRQLRADWRQEWEAELQYREARLLAWDRLDGRARLDLLWRSTSAFWDAVRLQPRRWEDELVQDLRFGLRQLGRAKGFAFIAVLTLALGIGANTAIFSVVNAVLLRPLPFKDPERLIAIAESNPEQGQPHGAVSGANFTDWKGQGHVFGTLAAYFNWNYNLTGDGEPQRLTATLVSGDFFQALQAKAVLGRSLLPADDQQANENVVVLSHPFWKGRFGASPEVIGRTIKLDDRPHTVVGVMPESFDFPGERADIFRPMAMSPRDEQNRQGKWLRVFGRLEAGVSLQEASAAMSAIATRLAKTYPATNAGWGVHLTPLQEEFAGNRLGFLWTLFAAVLLVLLIACMNVANLLLARALSRRKENALRAGLGASRLRLLRQFLTESLLLAVLGGALGVAFAFWGLDALKFLSPEAVPGLDRAVIDGGVFGFSLALSFAATIVAGLLPAWQASQPDMAGTLKAGSHVQGRAVGRLQSALIVAEVAAGVVLLVGAGLTLRSFSHLQAVQPGFDPREVLSFRITLPTGRYRENRQTIAFFQQALERVRSLPGVLSAGGIQDLPLGRNAMSFPVSVLGRPEVTAAARPLVAYRAVTDDYFRTMRIPVVLGRVFSADDTPETLPVVIINESMAKRFFPTEQPLGKRIRFGEPSDPVYTVVGVVGDVKHQGLGEEELPAVYQPHAQNRFSWLRWLSVVVRCSTEPLNLVPAIRSRIALVDRDQPIFDVATMEQRMAHSVTQPLFSTCMFGLFALLALSLAAVGLYGVMSHAVAQRTQELGLRMALGARARDVLVLVLERGMALTLTGLAIGMVLALALAKVSEALLFDLSPTDPLTFAGVAGLLLSVAMLACYLPARRAGRVDPMVALRND